MRYNHGLSKVELIVGVFSASLYEIISHRCYHIRRQQEFLHKDDL